MNFSQIDIVLYIYHVGFFFLWFVLPSVMCWVRRYTLLLTHLSYTCWFL